LSFPTRRSSYFVLFHIVDFSVMILLFAKCLVYLFVLPIFYRLFFGVAVYMHLKLDSCHEFSFISTLSSSFPFYMFSYIISAYRGKSLTFYSSFLFASNV